MSRAATSPELALYRTPGKWTKLRAAIFSPTTIFSAKVNQTFTSNDSILEITYDTPTGDYTDALPDMTVLVGSSPGAHDKGIVRLRSIDGSKFYISETSDISWANDLDLTVINDFGLWAKHVLIDDGTPYMDGGVEYSDQHENFDPVVIMGSNKVLELSGATVSETRDLSLSYVIDGSTIATYATTSPTASGGSGLTTSSPTLEFDTPGWHTVYSTLTATNGKIFFGVRYDYVWDPDDPPSPVSMVTPGRQEAETGGWEFEIAMLEDCTLSDVRDRALVILFAEDHFGTTQQSIGPLAGSENIVCMGWIAEESINWNPEQGTVSFRVAGAHFWMQNIPAYPDGVEFVTGTPAAWTEMQNLTVRLGLWHFLHWRTTCTRIMDVFLTDDTRLTKEVSSLAGNLWEQLREMGWAQIYARTIVNAHGQLCIEIHPQLVPEASRNWPTVMTITKPDWQDEINFQRVIKPEVSAVTLSGVAVNASGVGTPYFSIAPGIAYPHYGAIELQDNLLASSQSQLNTLAGLYRAWRNNQYPDIQISLDADIRLIDCAPRQKCAISIASGDTPRGITYSGNLIPTAITLHYDAETGYLRRDVTFEAETLEGLAVTHVVPGEGDRSIPPIPPLPPLPDFPVIIPGGFPEGTEGGPKTVVIHDTSQGLIFSTDFNNASPTWTFFNAGLTTAQKQGITFFWQCPNGVCYCGKEGQGTGSGGGYFLARTPSLGGTWTVLYDEANLFNGSGRWGIVGAAHNPLVSETVGLVMHDSVNGGPYFWLGSGGVFVKKVLVTTSGYFFAFILSYGLGKWMASSYGNQANGQIKIISADGSSSTPAGANDSSLDPSHVRASTTGRTFHARAGGGLIVGENNFASYTEYTDADISTSGDFQNNWFACDPSGTYCMTRYGAGERGRSSDVGSTWAGIPNLTFFNGYYFDWAGPTARFVAAGGSMIWYSPDFGDTWENKIGNLTGLAPIPVINLVKVLEY